MSTDVEPRRWKRLQPEARKAHILEAAAQLVATGGVAAVTMERVAEQAGVSRGLVYNYFDNSATILLALHDAEAHLLQEATEAATATAGDDLHELVARVARAWLDRFDERGPLLAALFSPQPPDGALADVERVRSAATHRMWTQVYEAAGGLDARTAADLTAMLLYAFTGALAQLGTGRTPEELTETYVDLAMGAVERIARRNR